MTAIRTCIGCRRQDAATEMVRLGVTEGRVIVAARARAGRGASIHARAACLEAGLRMDALSRAFKRRVTVQNPAELQLQITSALRR